MPQDWRVALAGLLSDADRRARKGEAARLAIDAHRGALARLLRLIDTALIEAGGCGYSAGRGAPGGVPG